LYLEDQATAAAAANTPDEVWSWMTDRRFLISVNACGNIWRVWRPILERHAKLRVLISHMGSPPARTKPPTLAAAQKLMTPVTDLAAFPGVHVKLSGFYGSSQPEHDYPHSGTWAYAQTLIQKFGVSRLLWGSDFTPALMRVSFPQTLDVLKHLPGLSTADRRRIEGSNLRRLIDEARER
jgi:predicted TIM-barrel fold metal-dependent hydrolase